MYRQTKAEEEEARREYAERLANERAQNLILDQLEKANAMQNFKAETSDPVGIRTHEPDFEEKTINKKRTVPSKGVPPPGARGPGASGLISPLVSTNTTAQFWQKDAGFYNLNAKVSKQSYAENQGIIAVIHGEAEGIKVSEGEEIKLRLLEPMCLIDKNQKLLLPIGSLISATAHINSDRLFVEVSGVFWEKQLIPVQISVFDLDGTEGIYVPSLLKKQGTNRLINNLGNPINSGQYFMPTGTVAQQVGSSLALNVAQNAFQTGSQYLRQRTRIQSVSLRNNYKVLLFNSTSKGYENKNLEEIHSLE